MASSMLPTEKLNQLSISDMAAVAHPSVPNGVESSRKRWGYLDSIISKGGPFTDPDSDLGQGTISRLEAAKVLSSNAPLYISIKLLKLKVRSGAGGLGCEILKNLALSGFKDIHVIDMDTIDVSNLNRQFLFREADVGKSKAEVAAAFIEKRVKGVKITPYNGKIQDKDEDYYMQFQLVLCGLDSVEARRWINATVVGMVDLENQDSLKPLIDGGTEGFKGQSRVILPTISSCIECQLDLSPPRAAVPLCTLANIPRQPQHCIEWAKIIAWEEHRKGDVIDTDDPEHITWLYHKALDRAQEFKIPGVTYSLTQGVIKHIIPAIASTNAIIAASCCNEALKIATGCNPFLQNYMQYTGDAGIYTFNMEFEQTPDCPVCGNLPKDLSVNPDSTLQELIESLGTRAEAQLKKPTLRTESTSLYSQAPPSLEEQTRPNLEKVLRDLVADGEQIAVSDPAFTIDFKFKIVYRS